MSFHAIKGNDKAIIRMKKAISKGIISHAYILEGNSCVDKRLVAETFIKAILCENMDKKELGDCCDICSSCQKIEHGNHEDLITIKADGNSIKDEVIEELQARIKKKPFGDRNIVIIEDADLLTLRAQNRLLKTLEEPTPGTVIILLSENIENLVQTVRSRCIHYKLNPFQEEEFLRLLTLAKNLEDMIMEGNPFFQIVQILNEVMNNKQDAYLFLDALESWYRDIGICEYDNNGNTVFNIDFLDEIERKSKIYKKTDIYKAVACIEEARTDLNRNINTSYTLKNMILKIGG